MSTSAQLQAIIDDAEEIAAMTQDELDQAVAALASLFGPRAAAHRLAELALEFAQIAEDEDPPMRIGS